MFFVLLQHIYICILTQCKICSLHFTHDLLVTVELCGFVVAASAGVCIILG